MTALHQTIAKEMTSGFKMAGNLGDGEGDIAALPTEGYVVGETYYVAKAGTYAGQTCEVGDMISCRATNGVDADWFVIQKNLINAIVGPATSVDGNLMAFNGVNGDTAKDSGLSMTDVSTAVNVGKALDAGKETLAKYGADANDNPTYNGKSIGTLQVVSSVEEATAANAPVGTVFFVVEEAAA